MSIDGIDLFLFLSNRYSPLVRYVKEKRPTISPNLNFMGQLLLFEEQLSHERTLICSPLKELSLSTPNTPTHLLRTDQESYSNEPTFEPGSRNLNEAPNPFLFVDPNARSMLAPFGFPNRDSNEIKSRGVATDVSTEVTTSSVERTRMVCDGDTEQQYLSIASSESSVNSTVPLQIDNSKVLDLFPTPPEESECRTFNAMFRNDVAAPMDDSGGTVTGSSARDKIRLSFGNDRTSGYSRPLSK